MGGPQPTSDGDDLVPEASAGDARDAPEVFVTLEQGACPICGLEFDERTRYGIHLAEVHDLHDDDGTESEFGTFVIRPIETAVPPLNPLPEEVRQRRQEPPQLGRPVGLLVLVVCLLGLFAGVIAYTGAQDEPTDEEVADTPAPTTAPTGDAASVGDAPGSSPSTTTPAAGAAGAPGTSATMPAEGTTPAPAPGASPTSAPTTLAPAPSTTAPGAAFSLPTASSARVTSCERDRDLWRVTYAWRFSGGSMWQPLSSYTSLGGGRYQHVVAVPRRDETAITMVSVTDPRGTPHSVQLRPALSSASC